MVDAIAPADEPPLSTEAQRPLFDQVLARIEGLILNGTLRPGDRLKEYALAEQWGISRAPIREACRMLQEAGVVDILPNRGAFVRKVSLRDVLHLFDIRAALWRLTAHQAAQNITHRQMDFLQELIAQMDEVIARGDTDGYLNSNSAFHEAILTSSGNRPLARLQRNLFIQARLFRRKALAVDTDLEQRNEDHRKLLRALREGSATEAGDISEQHVFRSKARFVKAMGADVDSFSAVFHDDGEDSDYSSNPTPRLRF